METTPDLSHYFAIHHRMRVDLRNFCIAVASAEPYERAGRLRALSRWANGFGHELHLHHTVEDDVIFPDLAARVASVHPVLRQLEQDHKTVARLLERLRPAAAALNSKRHSFPAAQEELLVIATTLTDLLERHLDIEDEDVLPLFYRHYSADEYDALTARVIAAIPKKGLAFSVPWNVELYEEDEREHVLATGSAGQRIVYRLAKRRYRRLVHAAFAGVDGLIDA